MPNEHLIPGTVICNLLLGELASKKIQLELNRNLSIIELTIHIKNIIPYYFDSPIPIDHMWLTDKEGKLLPPESSFEELQIETGAELICSFGESIPTDLVERKAKEPTKQIETSFEKKPFDIQLPSVEEPNSKLTQKSVPDRWKKIDTED